HHAPLRDDEYRAAMRALTPPLLQWEHQRHPHTVLMRTDAGEPMFVTVLEPGLMAALGRGGAEGAVANGSPMYPAQRAAGSRKFDSYLIVGSERAIAAWSHKTTAVPIVSYRSSEQVVAVFDVHAPDSERVRLAPGDTSTPAK